MFCPFFQIALRCGNQFILARGATLEKLSDRRLSTAQRKTGRRHSQIRLFVVQSWVSPDLG
jgi:hypothetical protein